MKKDFADYEKGVKLRLNILFFLFPFCLLLIFLVGCFDFLWLGYLLFLILVIIGFCIHELLIFLIINIRV